jgi:hypothetical protein
VTWFLPSAWAAPPLNEHGGEIRRHEEDQPTAESERSPSTNL